MTDLDVELVEDAAGELDALYQRDGKLTAESVLGAAADPTSPLHDRFEWDDTIAAHEYRLGQARSVVRSYYITIEERRVRRFPYVPSAGSFAPIREAMADKSWRDEIVAQFEQDAARFEARWANHKAVADAYRRWKSKI